MLETKKIELGGIEISCRQFPVMRAYALLHDLVKLIGPAAVQLEADDIVPVVVGSLMKLSHPEREKLTFQILAGTSVVKDGTQIDLSDPKKVDAVLGGDLMALFRAVSLALETNFAGFTDAVLALIHKPGDGDAATGELNSD